MSERPRRGFDAETLGLRLPQRQPARGDFQSFAPALSLELAVLLKRADSEPAQGANGYQRRRGEQQRDPARDEPGHDGSILRGRLQRFVMVVSRTRHGARSIRLPGRGSAIIMESLIPF